MSRASALRPDTRTCEREGCDNTFVCRHDSVRRYCSEHTNGAGLAGKGQEKTAWQRNSRDQRRLDNYEKLMEENTTLRAAARAARREDESAEAIRETVYKIAGSPIAPPDWLHTPTYGGAPGVPMTLWSDWHWDESVTRAEVGGLNEYNEVTQITRLQDLYKTVVDLCFAHMTSPTYPGIILMLGGDMITGEIHQELAETNGRYILETLRDLQAHLVAAIKVLADSFGRVWIPCVVGNHGRMTLKPRMKGIVQTSYEWHLYLSLQAYFKGDDRVQFHIPNETDARFNVYDTRFLLTHGDRMGVKGGDGIIGALGPIMRGAVKIGRAESQIKQDFDQLVIGHWHQYMPLRGINVNGSMKGYDEFARNALRAKWEPPIQSLWFVHQKYGQTAQWPIYLDGTQPKKQTQWVSWERERKEGVLADGL